MIFVASWFFLIGIAALEAVDPGTQLLKSGWLLQSSARINAPGEKISRPGFECRDWYPVTVPTTVLAALEKNGVYHDLYFGKNLDSVSVEPFRVSWWYRKEFDLEAGRAESVRLILDGINYSANLFVNGTAVASADDVQGAFRRFDFDISGLVHKKGNVLAIEVYPPKPGDFTIGFVDWNPSPPDSNLGLWREVSVRQTGAVTIEQPFVNTKLNLQSLKEARLTVTATLVNHSARPVSGTIAGEIESGIRFAQKYSLAPKESKEVRFSPEDSVALLVSNPRVWWPNNLGSPELYSLNLTARDVSGVSDSRKVVFGIREVADYFNAEGHRGYRVNGRKILIRGGGWVDDMMLHEDEDNLEAQIRYVKHLNLNTIRLEGFWGSSEKLYELADRYGLLVMIGFSCQWEWTHYLGKEADGDNFGGVKTEEDVKIVSQYLHDQVLWLRNHPSIFVWVLGSDGLPLPEFEKRYRAELAQLDTTRPILASTKGWESEISGPTAVKMNGPYDYVTPNYWYLDTENGGAFGFNTETGPGPQPPPAESIRKMFAKDHYWPIDDTWNYHCGRNEFHNLDVYLKAFYQRYGTVEDEEMEEFTKRAQAANYEAIRAMFESFGVRKPVTTGIVQWMLNAAWPKMYWQLYDYYLMPGGAYYGTRKANQPLNIAYDYSDQSVHIVNDTYDSYPELNAEIKALNFDSKEIFSQAVKASVGSYESKKVLTLPASAQSAPVYFLALKLKDSNDKTIADNFYWLSTKPDVLEYEGAPWFYTPNKEYADFTALNKLPPASIQVEQQWIGNGVNVILKNAGKQIAFFIELRVEGDKTGRSILPVFWDDNYISLLPGETKQVTARFSVENLHGEKPLLQYSGWNLE